MKEMRNDDCKDKLDVQEGRGAASHTLEQKMKMENELRQRPEYEMAWEFEMWRHAEEAKWRADLKEKENARMAILEDEWHKREKERAAQIQYMQEQNAILESKLRAKLVKLEKRERTFVLAEESAALKRDALDREYAQHATDAQLYQVVVKRLQAECELRVEMERTKYAALEDQHKSLEQRFASVNASLVLLEKQFSQYRASQRNTSEAELTAELMAANQKCSELERKLDIAVQACNKCKSQVLKMAKELASAHNQRILQEATKMAHEKGQNEARAVAALVKCHALKAQEEKLELMQLKKQLEKLQMSEQTCGLGKAEDKTAKAILDISEEIAIAQKSRIEPLTMEMDCSAVGQSNHLASQVCSEALNEDAPQSVAKRRIKKPLQD